MGTILTPALAVTRNEDQGPWAPALTAMVWTLTAPSSIPALVNIAQQRVNAHALVSVSHTPWAGGDE